MFHALFLNFQLKPQSLDPQVSAYLQLLSGCFPVSSLYGRFFWNVRSTLHLKFDKTKLKFISLRRMFCFYFDSLFFIISYLVRNTSSQCKSIYCPEKSQLMVLNLDAIRHLLITTA